MINHDIALKILSEIHKGNNGIEELDEIFHRDRDYDDTINALSEQRKPYGVIELTKPDYIYVIKGSRSDFWPSRIHDFLKSNGYQSKL